MSCIIETDYTMCDLLHPYTTNIEFKLHEFKVQWWLLITCATSNKYNNWMRGISSLCDARLFTHLYFIVANQKSYMFGI